MTSRDSFCVILNSFFCQYCQHIPHLWRRQFCGMVRGVDEGIHNITEGIKNYLGENTILYVVSDNGGSTWFGSLNTPFNGGKSTPLEGGVHVPAFIVDFTVDQKYLGGPGLKEREYSGLIHSADILPTILSYAGVPFDQLSSQVTGLDGFDLTSSFRSNTNESPRKEMLLELYNEKECIFQDEKMHDEIG